MKHIPRIILLIETSRAFGRGLLHGIARYSRLHGPWAFYQEPRGLKSAVPHLKSWKADGIIMRNSVIRQELIRLNKPTIWVLHGPDRPENIPAVITEDAGIAALAAEHLLNRGFHNYAFCGFHDLKWSCNRAEDFRRAIADAGYDTHIYDQPVSVRSRSWQYEQNHIAAWLNSLPKPVGIMACNDDRGHQVLEACKIAGLKVPEEVAVVGVDNDELVCELCDPPLSSIALNTEKSGFAAAELLDRLLQGETMNNQEIRVGATHVVRRQSTDIMAIDDQDVTSALRYIRQNANKKICVDDVVRETHLSRRSLENRFRNLFKRSIQEEVRRVRVGLISRMLIETNMNVTEIAATLNFIDVEHISRYFKTETGMGLREYRRLHRCF